MAYNGPFDIPKPGAGLYGAEQNYLQKKKPAQQQQQTSQSGPVLGVSQPVQSNVFAGSPTLGQAMELYKALSQPNLSMRDRADYEYNRAVEEARRTMGAQTEAQKELWNYQPETMSFGPIAMQKVQGAMTPRVIMGGQSQGVMAANAEKEGRLWKWLQGLMGMATPGQGPGVDFDAIRNSLLADVMKQDELRRRGVSEQFAGMGRSVTGTAAQEALGGVGEATGRSRLAALADVEKLKIQDQANRQAMINSILPTILSMMMKGYQGGV